MEQSKKGGYAVTTIHSMPWLSTEITVKKNKTTRQRSKNQIIYPIFQKCSEIHEDPYWQCLFNQASQGKLPRGFMYRNGVLTYRKGNKTYKLEILV